MSRTAIKPRTFALLAATATLLFIFGYVAIRSGPLAPVAVTVATVQSMPVTPALFGIGNVEPRYVYKIGPTAAGRLQQLDVNVGDMVTGGQVLGLMDGVDLNDRIRSQKSAYKAAEAALSEAQARQTYAQTQSDRYQRLFLEGTVSEETAVTKQNDLQIANAAYSAALEDVKRADADVVALEAQQKDLRLIAPFDGIVSRRAADPGTTIVAGQSVVEVYDPKSLWIHVRFDQLNASGLAEGQSAGVVLRSRTQQTLEGQVLRVEPIADAVTEELLAKVVLDEPSGWRPAIGELAEVTVTLPMLPQAPVIPNAAMRRQDDQLGVFVVTEGALHFTPIVRGASDLEGQVQVTQGLAEGDQVVVYSASMLRTGSRFRMVDRIPGVSQ